MEYNVSPTSVDAVQAYFLQALAVPSKNAVRHASGDHLLALIHDREIAVVCVEVGIAASPCARPAFAPRVPQQFDSVMLHIGDTIEGLMQVEADVTLCAEPESPWARSRMSVWSDHSSVWLVPDRFGPSVRIGPDGFEIEATAPYRSLVARALGVARAAYAMARLAMPEQHYVKDFEAA